MTSVVCTLVTARHRLSACHASAGLSHVIVRTSVVLLPIRWDFCQIKSRGYVHPLTAWFFFARWSSYLRWSFVLLSNYSLLLCCCWYLFHRRLSIYPLSSIKGIEVCRLIDLSSVRSGSRCAGLSSRILSPALVGSPLRSTAGPLFTVLEAFASLLGCVIGHLTSTVQRQTLSLSDSLDSSCIPHTESSGVRTS